MAMQHKKLYSLISFTVLFMLDLRCFFISDILKSLYFSMFDVYSSLHYMYIFCITFLIL